MLRYDFRFGMGGNALGRAADCRDFMGVHAWACLPEMVSSCGANSRCYGVIFTSELGECLDKGCLGSGLAAFFTMSRVPIADNASCLCPASITYLCIPRCPMHSKTQLPTFRGCVLRPPATSS